MRVNEIAKSDSAEDRLPVRNDYDPNTGEPHFYPRNGMLNFVHPEFGVSGAIDHRGTYCTIYEFSSSKGGKGHARQALKWLRRYFDHITVIDIGYEESDQSWQFWLKMAREGLVQRLYGDDDPATPVFDGGIYLNRN